MSILQQTLSNYLTPFNKYVRAAAEPGQFIPDSSTGALGLTLKERISLIVTDCKDTLTKLESTQSAFSTIAYYRMINATPDLYDPAEDRYDEEGLFYELLASSLPHMNVVEQSALTKKWVGYLSMNLSGGDIVTLKISLTISHPTMYDYPAEISIDNVTSSSGTETVEPILLMTNEHEWDIVSNLTQEDVLEYYSNTSNRWRVGVPDGAPTRLSTLSGTTLTFSSLCEGLRNAIDTQNILCSIGSLAIGDNLNPSAVLSIVDQYKNSSSANVTRLTTAVKSIASDPSPETIYSLLGQLVGSFSTAEVDVSNQVVHYATNAFNVQTACPTVFWHVFGQVLSVIGTIVATCFKGIGTAIGLVMAGVGAVVTGLTNVVANVSDAICSINKTATSRLYAQPCLDTTKYERETLFELLPFLRRYEDTLDVEGRLLLNCDYITAYIQVDDADSDYLWITCFMNLGYGGNMDFNTGQKLKVSGGGNQHCMKYMIGDCDFGSGSIYQTIVHAGENIPNAQTAHAKLQFPTTTTTQVTTTNGKLNYVVAGNRFYSNTPADIQDADAGTGAVRDLYQLVTSIDKAILNMTSFECDAVIRSRILNMIADMYLEDLVDTTVSGSFLVRTEDGVWRMNTNVSPRTYDMWVDNIGTESAVYILLSHMQHNIRPGIHFDSTLPDWAVIVNKMFPALNHSKLALQFLQRHQMNITVSNSIVPTFYCTPPSTSLGAVIETGLAALVAMGIVAGAVAGIAAFAKVKMKQFATKKLAKASAAREHYFTDDQEQDPGSGQTKENYKAMKKASRRANFFCKLSGLGSYNYMADWFEADSGSSASESLSEVFSDLKDKGEEVESLEQPVTLQDIYSLIKKLPQTSPED